MGPIYSGILLICLVAGLVSAARSVRAVRYGEDARLLPLVMALGFPLLLTVWATLVAYPSEVESALALEEGPRQQMLLAVAVSKVVLVQIGAGLVTAVSVMVVLLGTATSISLGERPRLEVAGVAAVLTFLITASCLASGMVSGEWGVAALRALVYLGAGLITTAALLLTHRRGPGAHLGPLAAATLPLLIAAVDAAASGWVSAQALTMAAAAAPVAKQGVLSEGSTAVAAMRVFSGSNSLLAVALAALGPVVSSMRSRELVRPQAVGVALGLLTAILAIAVTSTPLQLVMP